VDRQQPAAKLLWPTEEPPVASDPEQIAQTLRDLARLDPVALGQQAMLERIAQAAATCCASTGGVGLLLLDPDQQLCYVAAVGRPRRALAGSQLRLGQGPSVDAFLQDAPVASRDLAGGSRWPNFRPLALAAGIRAWLSAPLRRRHGPIGVLDLARTDPQPWQPQDLAAATGFARLIVATLQPARARQQQALSPALRFAVDHDARIEQARDLIMERERLDQGAAVELLRSRPRSRTNRSEPSPNASLPAPDVRSAPARLRTTLRGSDWDRTPRRRADAPMISRAKRIAQRGRTLPKSAPPGRCRKDLVARRK
jgi:GAF domain-containing protein